MEASLVFRFHDRGPEVVREVLLERGWEEYDKEQREEEDWNLYWRGSAFGSSEYNKLLPWQRLNHHPKTVGITRKDFLARNLRRMRATFGSGLYDFSPTAFILPNDYTHFLSEHNRLRQTRGGSVYWICKPVDLSRGRGIFIFRELKDLAYDCPVIVQRYISDPLLVSGYKFDLRIYVCVKSFHPLSVYVHQEGLVRFSTEKYDLQSLGNPFAHLTNTSINKLGPFYRSEKERVGQGCKWTMSRFRHFLQGQDVDQLLLWMRISNIVTLTLLTIAPSIPRCPNCVELFGFDVLIDSRFKPWLLEVNYSPALTLDCQADITVKKGLVGDLIDLMNYTLTDSLRERAYRRPGKQQFCHRNQQSHASVPVIFKKFKETKAQKRKGSQSSKPQTLPKLKTLHDPEKTNRRQHPSAVGNQSRLPPVDVNKIFRDTQSTKTGTDRTLNPILGPHSRTKAPAVKRRMFPDLAKRVTDNKSLQVSEVTHCDQADREMDLSGNKDVSNSRCLGFGSSAVSWKLPDIHRTSSEGETAKNGRQIPPIRVGDFIRTFPFNKATLKASQTPLDVKKILQEIHKLTAQLGTSGKKLRRDKNEEEEGEEDFDSLLWGPKDPPLLRHCFSST